MATIVDGKKRIPFMRGMLVHHLIQRGFDHDEAYDVADSVRQVVRELGEIDKKDMLKLIAEVLQEHYPDRPIGDHVFWESRPTTTITVERRKGPRPFSKETLSRSLQASGLAPDDAYDIAREIESGLVDQGCSRITHTELQEAAVTALTERHGISYAERYFIVRALKDLDKPLVILIGGTSGVGKTTLAVSLANVLDIPRVVATDDIRQIMRLTLAPELMPAIHVSSYQASEVTTHDESMDPVVAGFREQARTVAVGVHAILSRAMEENNSVIVDGVHLLPGILDLSEYEDRAFLAPLCLSISDEEVFEERFQQRAAEAPERSSEKYLSHMTHILTIQDYILENTTRDDIPVIDTTTVDDLTSSAVMVVVERLQDRDEVKKALESAPFSKRLKNRRKKKKKGKG